MLRPTYYDLPTTTYILRPAYCDLPTAVYLVRHTCCGLPTVAVLLLPTCDLPANDLRPAYIPATNGLQLVAHDLRSSADWPSLPGCLLLAA